jgi:hypothetical protein
VSTQQVLKEQLTDASKSLTAAMASATTLKLQDKNPRAFQQINNALIRADAALDEIQS